MNQATLPDIPPPRPRGSRVATPPVTPKKLVQDIRPVEVPKPITVRHRNYFLHVSPWLQVSAHEYTYFNYALLLAGLVALAGLAVLWGAWLAYCLLLGAITGAVIFKLSHRFLFLGMIFVLGELLTMILLRQKIAAEQLATFFFWLFLASLLYLTIEIMCRRFQPKDKSTTNYSFKNNKLFQRVLLRKYLK